MARSNEHHWLDDAIAKTAPGPPPKPDFQAWRNAHAGALDALRQRGRQQSQDAPRVVRVLRGPLARLAIAAAILTAVFLLARHLVNRASTPVASDPDLVQGAKPESPAGTQESQAVLAKVERLSTEGDTEGLLAVLETDRVDVKILVIEYLGRTADDSALPALEQFAADAPDSSGGKAARQAIDQIRRRAGLADGSRDTQVAGQYSGESSTRIIVGPRDDRRAAGAGEVVYRGRVTEPVGKPVGGVRVWGMALTADLRRRDFDRETLTDADGRFQLVARASDPMTEVSRTLRFDHPDYAMGWCPLSSADVETAEDIDVTLYAATELGGTVVDTAGRPIPTALIETEVRAPGDDQAEALRLSAWTDSATHVDERGRFVLKRLPAGSSVRLTVSAEGHATRSTLWRGGTSLQALAGDREDLTITLEPGRPVVGRVVYDDGRPYGQRALIEMDAPDITDWIFATDDAGRFTSPGVAAGSCVFTALRSEDRLLSAPVNVRVDLDSRVPEVELKVLGPGMPVEVRTVDEATGAPLTDVLVHAAFVDGKETGTCARTDEMGRCTLNLPQGQFQIVAEGWKDGHFEPFSQPLTVESGLTRQVQMRMTGRTQVVGRLVDSDGKGVQGIVQLVAQPLAETDPGGWFVVDEPLGDPCEHHVLWARDRAGWLHRMIGFRMADYTDALTVELKPCAVIVGYAVDADAHPLDLTTPGMTDCQLAIDMPDGAVFFYGRRPWTAHSRRDGTFSFVPVPTGLPLFVTVDRDSWQGEVRIPQLSPGQTLELNDVVARLVDPFGNDPDRTRVLVGTVTDEKGKPMVGVSVRAFLRRDARTARTNEAGLYALTVPRERVRLKLEIAVPGRGYCYRYIYTDSENGNVQVRAQGWDLLGRPAPPLSAQKAGSGGGVNLDEFRGKVVLLKVGAPESDTSIPTSTLRTLASGYGAYGLEVIAVHHSPDARWVRQDTQPRIPAPGRREAASFLACVDVSCRTWTAYRADVTPTLYLIDREGYVRMSPTENDLKRCITTLLAE
ncbi:MAG: carboxypeptidase regulatory-like domain-containing protein [Sedimentisphaerales bacterium]|nr:carboxypeptidase regulatory-like domain-containing protein [Sedimentisphaerales bacterium]